MQKPIIHIDSGLLIICDPNYLIKYGLNWSKLLADIETQTEIGVELTEIKFIHPHCTGILLQIEPGEYTSEQIINLLTAKENAND